MPWHGISAFCLKPASCGKGEAYSLSMPARRNGDTTNEQSVLSLLRRHACFAMVATMITVDHSDEYPYAYYDEWEGITSANNPEFWYALGMLKPNYPVPACEAHNWSDWFSNEDGFWNRPETERLWRLERTLWANGF